MTPSGSSLNSSPSSDSTPNSPTPDNGSNQSGKTSTNQTVRKKIVDNNIPKNSSPKNENNNQSTKNIKSVPTSEKNIPTNHSNQDINDVKKELNELLENANPLDVNVRQKHEMEIINLSKQLLDTIEESMNTKWNLPEKKLSKEFKKAYKKATKELNIKDKNQIKIFYNTEDGRKISLIPPQLNAEDSAQLKFFLDNTISLADQLKTNKSENFDEEAVTQNIEKGSQKFHQLTEQLSSDEANPFHQRYHQIMHPSIQIHFNRVTSISSENSKKTDSTKFKEKDRRPESHDDYFNPDISESVNQTSPNKRYKQQQQDNSIPVSSDKHQNQYEEEDPVTPVDVYQNLDDIPTPLSVDDQEETRKKEAVERARTAMSTMLDQGDPITSQDAVTNAQIKDNKENKENKEKTMLMWDKVQSEVKSRFLEQDQSNDQHRNVREMRDGIDTTQYPHFTDSLEIYKNTSS